MLLMTIGWSVVAIGVACIIIGWLGNKENTTVVGVVLTVFFGFVLLLTTIIVPLSNQTRLQEMGAFYIVNSRNYEMAATKTQVILSEQRFIEGALIPVEGSIEKFELADQVADRLVEWRNAAIRYNDDLAKFRYFHDHLLMGAYYPEPVGLKQLIIE